MTDPDPRQGATPKEARAALNIKRQTMSNWNKNHWLMHFDDGSIDVEATRQMVERYRNSAMLRDRSQKPDTQTPADVPAPAPEPLFVTYDEADRRLKLAQAQIAELKEAQMRGDLIPREIAERVYCDAFAKLKANIEAIPNRTSELLVGQVEAVVVRRILQEAIEEALKAVSSDAPNLVQDV